METEKIFRAIIAVDYPGEATEFKKYNTVYNTPAGLKSFETFAKSIVGCKSINYYEKRSRRFVRQVKVA